jgi:hypothetical protein
MTKAPYISVPKAEERQLDATSPIGLYQVLKDGVAIVKSLGCFTMDGERTTRDFELMARVMSPPTTKPHCVERIVNRPDGLVVIYQYGVQPSLS